jgi:hypothetical protein
MAKTFVPQLVRILRRVCNYIQKHHATLASTLTNDQMVYLDGLVTGCNNLFGTYDVNSQP